MKWVLIAVGVLAAVGGLIYASQRDDDPESPSLPPSITWEVVTEGFSDLSFDDAFSVEGDPRGVFLVSAENRLYEVSREGGVTWALQTSDPLGGCYWASDNSIGFWVEGNGLYVVSRDGELMWKCLDEHLSCAAPSAWDDVTRAVVGTDVGVVYGTYRGSVEWSVDTGGEGVTEYVSWVSTEEGRHGVLLRESNVVVEVYPDGELGGSWDCLPERSVMVDVLPSGGILVCNTEKVAEYTPQEVTTWEYGEVSPAQCHRLPTGSTMLMSTTGDIVTLAPNEYPMWRAWAEGANCVRWSLNGGGS